MDWGLFIIALTASTIGLLLITFISPSLDPPHSNISDITSLDIERAVLVSGEVVDYHIFAGGSTSLTLSDNQSQLTVFLPPNAAGGITKNISVGSTAEVRGVVRIYRGAIELFVENPEDIMLK